jgi:tetratricopeptide (TPR) repeat protein
VAAAAVDWGLFGGVLSSLSATAIWKLLDPEQPDPSSELVNAELENEDIRGKLHEALVAGGLDTKIGAAIGNLEPGLAEEAWKAYTGFLEEQKRFLDKMVGRLEAVDKDVRRLITAQQQGAFTLAVTPGHLHEYLKDWVPANLVRRPELNPIIEQLEQGRIHKLVLLGRALSGKSILAGQVALRWLSKSGRAVALLATRPQTEQFQALAGLNPDRHLVICDLAYSDAEPLTPEEMVRFRNLSCSVIVCQRLGQPKFHAKEKTMVDYLRSGPGGDYHQWNPDQDQPSSNGRVLVTLGGVDRNLAEKIISGNVRTVFPDGGITIKPEAREILVDSMQALDGEDKVSIPGLARIVLLFMRSSLGPRPGEIDQTAAWQIITDLGLNRRGLGEAEYEKLLQRLFIRIINRDQEMILQVMARWQKFAKTPSVPRLALESGYETKFKKNLNHEALLHLRDLEAAGVLTLADNDDSYRAWHPKQLDVLADDEPYETRYVWLKESLAKLDEVVKRWLTEKNGPAVALGMANFCSGLQIAKYSIRELTTIWKHILELKRNIFKTDPATYLADVASTANNMGNLLNKVGERTAARELYEEALEIRRKLAKSEPGAWLPDVAMSANNLGALLHNLGERAAAKELCVESLEIYRNLAKAEPAAYLPDVAMSANNLGALLNALGDHGTARQLYEEALEIRRNLAKAEPGVYLPDVASTANNLGNLLRILGERTTARALYQEALAIRRELAKTEPGAYLSDVAMTANNLGNLLSNLGERVAARKLYGEALEIRRELAESEPGAYLMDVATTANNLGVLLSDLGERAAAGELFQEALAIRRNLAKSEPAAYLPYVAMTANNLGALLRNLGERAVARALYQEALAIRRNLAKSEPAAYLADYAGECCIYGVFLLEESEWDEAATYIKEAVVHLGLLTPKEPSVFGPRLQASLAMARLLYWETAFKDHRETWLAELKAKCMEAVGEEETTELIGVILEDE